jgi:Trm5-related predicted tRNA methylase
MKSRRRASVLRTTGEVRFCVTGDAWGAVLKSCVTDSLREWLPLADRLFPDGAKKYEVTLRSMLSRQASRAFRFGLGGTGRLRNSPSTIS